MHPLNSNLGATLRRLPLFNDLSEDELALIAKQVTIHLYDSGRIVISEGDICGELLIVQQGTVKILKTAPSGRQQLIGIQRTGNSLSESRGLRRRLLSPNGTNRHLNCPAPPRCPRFS